MCVFFQLRGSEQPYQTPKVEGKPHLNILNVSVSTGAIVLNFAHVVARSVGGVMVTYTSYDIYNFRIALLACFPFVIKGAFDMFYT